MRLVRVDSSHYCQHKGAKTEDRNWPSPSLGKGNVCRDPAKRPPGGRLSLLLRTPPETNAACFNSGIQ